MRVVYCELGTLKDPPIAVNTSSSHLEFNITKFNKFTKVLLILIGGQIVQY